MNEAANSTDQPPNSFVSHFKEVIYGGIDGIVTTFAVVAGFSGAALSSESTTQLTFLVVLLFGLANLFTDAASMGLGNFLSVRTERELYFKKRREELDEMRDNPRAEYQETITILQQKGFSLDQAETLAQVYKTNEEYWADFMMTHEHEVADPRGENPIFTGLATATAFIVFGAIPLLPFIFISSGDAAVAFKVSSFGTFLALVTLGAIKWRVLKGRFWASILEVVVVGGTAAVIAYWVGTFFSV